MRLRNIKEYERYLPDFWYDMKYSKPQLQYDLLVLIAKIKKYNENKKIGRAHV